ncbi:MAG: DMT family transporter, partial [Firmicutes bacterium]|nr:DMT family transporter [Bacillota bacterium]
MNKSLILALITILIWGTSAPTVKVITQTIPSMQALSVGSAIAALFLLLLNAACGRLKKLHQYAPKDLAVMGGLGTLGLFSYYSLYYYGIRVLSTQEACIINYLWPIMIVIFSILILKEPLTMKKLLAIGCSFGGIVLLVLDG